MYAHAMVYFYVADSTEDRRASRTMGSTMGSLMGHVMGSTEEEGTMGRTAEGTGKRAAMGAGRGGGPPVNWSGMPSLGDELRGQILWGPTQGEGLHAWCQPFGKPKVRHLQVAIGVQQQVLRLQIPAPPSCRAAKGNNVHTYSSLVLAGDI